MTKCTKSVSNYNLNLKNNHRAQNISDVDQQFHHRAQIIFNPHPLYKHCVRAGCAARRGPRPREAMCPGGRGLGQDASPPGVPSARCGTRRHRGAGWDGPWRRGGATALRCRLQRKRGVATGPHAPIRMEVGVAGGGGMRMARGGATGRWEGRRQEAGRGRGTGSGTPATAVLRCSETTAKRDAAARRRVRRGPHRAIN